MPATIAGAEDANNACGWTLAVVYKNSSLHQRNLSLFVGNSFATAGGPPPNPVGVNGFCVPPTGPVNGFLFLSAIEGDPQTINDQMKFGTTTNNLAVLSGPNNPANNFFASQINLCQPDNFNNLTNGTLDTTGTFGLSNSIPGTGVAGARQGWDITCVNVSSSLTNGVTSAYAQNITTGDGYSVNALALQIDVGSPVLATAQSVDKASTYIGDTLTYTVGVTNSGNADAVNLIFTDPLPFGTSFIANTFKTNGVTIAGANPVAGVPISIIKQNGNFSITYQVLVNQVPPNAKFVTAATIDFQFTGPCALSPIINATLVNLDVNTYIPLLAVNKVSSLTNVTPNALMTYAVNIPNSGSTNTLNSTLIDPIPAGVSYVTNTTTLNGISVPDINGTNMPFTVSREIHSPTRPAGQINAGETAVVTFQVRIDSAPPARIHNSAMIFMNSNFPTSAQSADAYLPPIFTDLAAGITGNPNPVAAGAPFSLTITVTNKGPNAVSDATNFVTLTLPLAGSILSPVYSPSVGSYNALNGVWSGITLPSNGVITLTVSGQIDPTASAGSLFSTVTVAPPPGVIDVNSTNNTARSTNAITRVADLALTISDGVSNVPPGTPLTYTITAVNLGPSTLNTISVSNFVSVFLTNVTFNPNQGTFNSFDGTWSGLNLAAGDSVALTLQATVRSNVVGLFTNSSIVFVPPGVTDPVPANNSGSDVDIALPPTDVAVFKSAPANVLAGTNFDYTITVTNLGSVTASNVVVSDVLPVNVAFVIASGNGVNSSGTVTWSIGSLAANGRSNLTLTVTAPASGSISNVATVTTTTPDTNPTNNLTPPVSTSVTPVANLAIGKTGPASIFAGINFSYTIAVTNFGPSTATSLSVTDSLPAGVVFVSSLPATTTNAANQVIWTNVTDLASGAVTNLTLTVTATARGLVTNVASAGSPVIDTTPTNNISVPVISAVTNRPPVVANDLGSTPRNVPVTIPVLANDSDPDGDPLTIITVSATNGTPVIAGTNVVYTPGNTPGTNTIIYTVTDGNGGTNTGLITISVTNRPPVANNDAATTPINVPVTIPVLANDSDPDGDMLTIVSVSPTNGTASISGTNVVFTPTNNLPGVVHYTITDGFGGTNSALVSVSVSNRPPVVVNDLGSTPRNVPVTIPVLANDSDPDGDLLTINTVSATNGTPVIAGTNVVYTPGNTPGTNTIIYTVTDGNGGTNTGLITISVTNRPPVANNDTATTPINVPVTIPVLTNDSDPDGDVLTIVSVSPTNGTASISGTNVVFTPTNNLPGTVLYTITDGFGGTNSALVTITASPVADLAIGMQLNATAPSNSVVAFSPLVAGRAAAVAASANVLAGTNFDYTISVTNLGPSTASAVVVTDTLPAGVTFVGASGGGIKIGNQVVWSLGTMTVGQSSNLTLTVIPPPDGSLTNQASVSSPTFDPFLANNVTPLIVTPVTPVANVAVGKSGPAGIFAGTNFNYTIAVTNFGPSTATALSVTDNLPAGLVFVSSSPATTTNAANQVIWVNVTDLAAGAVTNLTLTVRAPARGGVTNTAAGGSPVFDPAPANNFTPPVVTSITNRPPVASNDTATTPVNVPVTIPVLANDSDPDGDVLTIVNVSPTNGTASISGTNVVFTPTNSLPGTVRYTITDGFGGTNSALVTVSVTNRPPVAVNDTASTPQNVAVTVPVLVNDSDPDGDALTIVSVSPTNGTAVISGANVVFTPLANFVGSGTVGYRISDGNGGTNAALITITVTNLPAPMADIQVLLFGPTNVTVGDGFSYTIVVTNAGPSSATNTLVQDVLPTNLLFSSASGGGVLSSNVVIWPVFPVLVNGQSTNLMVTVTPGAFGSTNLIQTNNPNPFNYIETNTTAFFGFLTNVVSAFATTFDPNLTNNTGTLSPLASVQTQIVPGVFSIFIATNTYPTNLSGLITNTIIPIGNNLFIVGTSAFNPQTGLYEESVTVTNLGTTVVHGLRLNIGGLRPGVTIYNATGTNNGVPYVEYRPPFSSPLQPFPTAGNSVTFQLEFFVADRHPFTNSLTAEAILTASAGITNGVSVPVSQQFTDFRSANGRFVLGFNSIPGRTYTILYGDSIGTITNIAVPSIVASANATQWYDDGPPKTLSKPTAVGSRFYQVILNP